MAQGKLEKILFVDDDPDMHGMAQVALEMVGGFQLCRCLSGTEALIKGPGFLPDLILLDVVMPDMDGPATFAALKSTALLDSVPVVYLTARSDPEEVAAYKASGILGVIHKPFDPMKLAEDLNNIWNAG